LLKSRRRLTESSPQNVFRDPDFRLSFTRSEKQSLASGIQAEHRAHGLLAQVRRLNFASSQFDAYKFHRGTRGIIGTPHHQYPLAVWRE
jgi:hypothetical protein